MELRSIGVMDSQAPVDSQRLPDKPKHEVSNRRDRYRLKSDAKILVKVSHLSSQVGTMRDLSRTGIFFRAFGDYQPGMTIEVVFPYDAVNASFQRPQQAEVVRVEEIEGSLKKGVAVKLLSLFLKA